MAAQADSGRPVAMVGRAVQAAPVPVAPCGSQARPSACQVLLTAASRSMSVASAVQICRMAERAARMAV